MRGGILSQGVLLLVYGQAVACLLVGRYTDIEGRPFPCPRGVSHVQHLPHSWQ